MATLIRHRWTSSFEGMSRRDRKGCGYDAYLPDPLAGWDLALPADLVADLTDAEAAIRRLNTSTTTHVSLEGLARFLLRAESVASSRIEGLEAGPRRLLDAEVVLAQGGDAADRSLSKCSPTSPRWRPLSNSARRTTRSRSTTSSRSTGS